MLQSSSCVVTHASFFLLVRPRHGRATLCLITQHCCKGFDGLASLLQDRLRSDPFSGQALRFQGGRAQHSIPHTVCDPRTSLLMAR